MALERVHPCREYCHYLFFSPYIHVKLSSAKQIVGGAYCDRLCTALRTCIRSLFFLRSLHHILFRFDLHTRQDLSFRNIRRKQIRRRQKIFLRGLDGVVIEEFRAAGRYHHRIHHYVCCIVFLKLFSDLHDQLL